VFATNLLSVVERLVKFPESGRIVPERNDPHVREIIFGNYRIVYRLRHGTAELLTIHHAARPLDLSRVS